MSGSAAPGTVIAQLVEAMRARKPDLETIEVPDQGHAPLLVEHETIGQISSFVANCERSGAQSGKANVGLASGS